MSFSQIAKRVGGYEPPDSGEEQEIPPEFLCRCCGEFNQLHEEGDICGKCQDALEDLQSD